MLLKQYLITYLGKLNETFNYSETDFESVVTETLMDYGVSTESEATDLKKLYTLAKMHFWKKLLIDCAGDYSYSADGTTYNRSQLFEHVQKMYQESCTNASIYLDDYSIQIGKITFTDDPYINVYEGW